MSISVLDRELYDIPLAASVLRVPASTLAWWLEGGKRNGRLYDPVIRPAPTGSKAVTWGEFVEARYGGLPQWPGCEAYVPPEVHR